MHGNSTKPHKPGQTQSMSACTQMEFVVLGPVAANEISKFPLLATTLSRPQCDIR